MRPNGGVGAFSEALRQEVYQDNIRVTGDRTWCGCPQNGRNTFTNPEAKKETQEWVHSIKPLAERKTLQQLLSTR